MTHYNVLAVSRFNKNSTTKVGVALVRAGYAERIEIVFSNSAGFEPKIGEC